MRWPHRPWRDARAVLERRYHRLLACYPAGYRDTHEDEMVGVALAGSAPEQRWPRSGEALRLIAGGTRMRLRLLPAGLRGPAWRDGAAAFVFLGAALLAAVHTQWLAEVLALGGGTLWPASAGDILLAALWLLTAVAVTLRWRWVAAAGALLAVIGDGAHGLVWTAIGPFFLVLTWWQLVLALATALAAVTLLPGPAHDSRPLSRKVVAMVAAAAAVFAAAPAIELALTSALAYGGIRLLAYPLIGVPGLFSDGLIALLALTVLLAIARINPGNPGARRRALVLVAPVVTAGVLSTWWAGRFAAGAFAYPGFSRFAALSYTHPALLAGWAVIVGMPALVFIAGLVLVSKYERMPQQVAGGQRDPG